MRAEFVEKRHNQALYELYGDFWGFIYTRKLCMISGRLSQTCKYVSTAQPEAQVLLKERVSGVPLYVVKDK